jgi:hypothetical protein
MKYIVRDLTKEVEDKVFDTKKDAEWWVQHLWQWRPNSRPVIDIMLSQYETK